jgi:hypothetical protein
MEREVVYVNDLIVDIEVRDPVTLGVVGVVPDIYVVDVVNRNDHGREPLYVPSPKEFVDRAAPHKSSHDVERNLESGATAWSLADRITQHHHRAPEHAVPAAAIGPKRTVRSLAMAVKADTGRVLSLVQHPTCGFFNEWRAVR